MLTADEPKLARLYFDLLLQELHRLGMTSNSPGYSTLLTAINNLLPDSFFIPSSFNEAGSKNETESAPLSIIPKIKSEPIPFTLEYLKPLLKKEVKQESRDCLGIDDDALPDSVPSMISSVDTIETLDLIGDAADISVDDEACSLKCPELGPFEGIVTSDWNGNIQYGCPFYPCSISYSTVDELKEHCTVHQRCQNFSCSWGRCGKVFRTSDVREISRHTMTHLGGSAVPESAPSPTCSSARENILTAFEAEEHTEQNIIKADLVFGAESVKQQKIVRYKKLPASLTCDICLKGFRFRSGLNIHMRNHTGDRPFKCSWESCEKAYIRNAHLRQHIRHTHNGYRPFKCTWEGCKKSFSLSCDLRKHIRIHTGDRPFQCSWEGCKRTFTENSNLRKHINVHSSDRPFKCSWEGCEKSFVQKSYLKAHQEVHVRTKITDHLG